MKDQDLFYELKGKSQEEAFQILMQKGVLNPELTLCEAQDIGLSLGEEAARGGCVLVCWW
ncbi:hypothetical protein [Bacillus cytotoxicus]|uniref:hypothetical protein n=1 Tax=Bacillus cytotoxicus TaxID=580165 RepID=UPI001AEE0C3E|nr:hypothetical protein [Bacillus cytotoxicus]QTR78475.1 hypothetical protein JC773_18650 [Bacillus cytotoxicus]